MRPHRPAVDTDLAAGGLEGPTAHCNSVLFPVPFAPKMHSAPGDSYVSDNPSITGRPPP